MNSLHDARAWEIVRRLADPHKFTIDQISLRDKARDLVAEASELEEAKRMIAHLQSIRLGLLEAFVNLLKMAEDGDFTTIELNEAREAIKAAQAGKVPPPTAQAAASVVDKACAGMTEADRVAWIRTHDTTTGRRL